MKKNKFKSPEEWFHFCDFVIKTNRYVLNKNWDNFVDAILFSGKKRETILEKGTKLVRARIGSYENEGEDENGTPKIDTGPLPPKELMAPPPSKAKEGRINPRGISYLYLSNCEKTAVSEVRPWIGQNVSVGYFETKTELKCIDTSQDRKGGFLPWAMRKQELTSKEKEEFVWSGINNSFSRPVRSEDEMINYIPTQYLSELFKTNGYDGIIYKSALTEKGYNIVLFDPQKARVKGAMVFQINSIKYDIEQCDNPYVVNN